MRYGKKKAALAGMLVLLLLLSACGGGQTPDKGGGEKTITIEIVHKDGLANEFSVQTTQEYLGPALLEAELVAGSQKSYGLYIDIADGEEAVERDEEWWCLTKDGGEAVMTGVDSTPIADGDRFELTLTVGY